MTITTSVVEFLFDLPTEFSGSNQTPIHPSVGISLADYQPLLSGPTKAIRRYDGPIFLPPQIYKLLSQDEMKALKAYNTVAINRFHQRKVHNTEIVETPQDDPPGPPVPENGLPDLPESDLDIPDDQILEL